MKPTILIVFLFAIVICSGQSTEEKSDWLPLFENRLPSRFFTFTTNYNFEYSINSSSSIQQIGDGFAEISGNRNAGIDLKFPVLKKPNLLLAGSLKYSDEQFYFEDHNPESYPLYVSLNDRNLKNLGGYLNGIFHLKNNRSILARTSLYLAGDFYRNGKSFSFGKLLKLSLAVGYGIKKDNRTFYAFGLYTGYTFGRPSIYPAMVFSKRFNQNIGLDATLPQNIKIWKKHSEKTYVFAQSKVSGNSYTIKLQGSVLEEYTSLQLRQSYLDTSFGVIQKLGKWIWMEGECGYSHNFSFNISEGNFIHGGTLPKPNNTKLIESKVSGSPYFQLSVFLAPPKDFVNRFLK